MASGTSVLAARTCTKALADAILLSRTRRHRSMFKGTENCNN